MLFYRAHVKTIKEVIKIHSRFLMRGKENKKCISWVSWYNACKPKEESGLGIRHIGYFNKAFLSK